MKYSLVSLLTTVLVASTTIPIQAWSNNLSIIGNGSNSINSIKLRHKNRSITSQYNNFTSINQISINSNTGGNTSNGNTGGNTQTNTGDITNHISIINSGGHNYSTGNNCCTSGCNHDDNDDHLCTIGSGWAATTVDVNQGTKKDDTAITDTDRTDPSSVVGAADGSFFSLGKNGSLVASFDTPVHNVDGVDLSFHEITNGRGDYPEEKITVEVSDNGTDWFAIGNVTNNDGEDGVGYLDFDSSGLDTITHVRITDSTNYDLHDNQADGYDLDAIDAVELLCE